MNRGNLEKANELNGNITRRQRIVDRLTDERELKSILFDFGGSNVNVQVFDKKQIDYLKNSLAEYLLGEIGDLEKEFEAL